MRGLPAARLSIPPHHPPTTTTNQPHSLCLPSPPPHHTHTTHTHLCGGGSASADRRMASGPLSSGCSAGAGGGPRGGCRRLNSCMGVCPKWRICSSTAVRCGQDGARSGGAAVGEGLPASKPSLPPALQPSSPTPFLHPSCPPSAMPGCCPKAPSASPPQPATPASQPPPPPTSAGSSMASRSTVPS